MARWSSEDEKIGVDMLAKNKTCMDIAQTLQRSSSAIRNHFDNDFFFRYRKKQVKQLWETFNSTHKNHNHNHNKIEISNLKINDYVYIMMYIECEAFYEATRCVGWIKSKIYHIKSDKVSDKIRITIGGTDQKARVEFGVRIRIKFGGLGWVEANESRIQLSGENLYYYDAYNNKICCAETFSRHYHYPELNNYAFNPELFGENNIECICSCDKLMIESKIKDVYPNHESKNGDTIECVNCKTKYKSKHAIIYHSDDKNDVHSTTCDICNICGKLQMVSKLCATINCISFLEFDSNQKNQEKKHNILNKADYDDESDDESDDDKQQNNTSNNKPSFIGMSIGHIKKLKRNDIIHFKNENNQWMLVKVEMFSTWLQLRSIADDKFIANFNYECRNDNEIISNIARCLDYNCKICFNNSNKMNQEKEEHNILNILNNAEYDDDKQQNTKVATQKRNNNNKASFISMSIGEIKKLKRNDIIHFENDTNQWMLVKVYIFYTMKNKLQLRHRTDDKFIANFNYVGRNDNEIISNIARCRDDNCEYCADNNKINIDSDVDMNENENIERKKNKKNKKKKLKKNKLPIFENIDNDIIQNEDPNIHKSTDEDIILITNTNTNTNKRSFNEMDEFEECKEQEEKHLIINQPKTKKRRINNEEFNNFDADITTMSVEEARNLEKGDFIDHQYRNGKYMEAKIINKRGSDLRIKYLNMNDPIWSDYADGKYELSRFAKHKSISNRPSHRLNHLKIKDTVYLNLKISFQNKEKYKKLGWIKCIVQDKENGQIKVEFIWQNEAELYWVHLDNKDLINDDEKWVQMQMTRYIPESIKRQIAADQEWLCACCKKPISPNFEIDHIKPVHEGGTNDRRNCQALNPPCHRNKTNKDRIGYDVNINPKELEKNKVKLWLKKCGLAEKVYGIFIENDIDDMETVQLVDLDSLKSIGINSIGLQLKLIKNINELKQTCLKKL